MTADEKIATRNAFQAKPHFHKLVRSSGKCCGSVEICWLIVVSTAKREQNLVDVESH